VFFKSFHGSSFDYLYYYSTFLLLFKIKSILDFVFLSVQKTSRNLKIPAVGFHSTFVADVYRQILLIEGY